jgi:adenylate cyclase
MASEGTQRRLAAILFTDVVGSTALTAHSQAAGLALRDRHRELVRSQVERYHGRFIEAPGDECLSAFESGLNAVNCALAIKQELGDDADLQLHTGLHLGEIAFRGNEVFGDGVNVAARVCKISPPGEIYVSGALAGALRGQEQVETSPRGEEKFKGVDEPVTIFAISGTPAEPTATAEGFAQPGGRPTPWVVAAAALLVVLGVGWWLYEWTRPKPPGVGPPAIAVLPFDNLGGGSEQDIFAGGLAEELITRLASWRSFPVISRGSSSDPALPQDVQQVGRELGAGYVVEGSVREAGDRVRIVVQLIDATTGRSVWAHQYDRELGDFWALQDEISEAIVGAMNPALLHSEMERAMRQEPGSLDAWNAAMQGWWHFDQFTAEHMAQAKERFARAVELDPQWGYAYAGLSLANNYELAFGWTDSPEQSLQASLEAAQKAVTLDELSAEGFHALGHAFSNTGQTDRMMGAFREGVELNPSHHLANNCYGYHLAWTGHPEEAIEYITRAMSLSPREHPEGAAGSLCLPGGRVELGPPRRS